MKSSTNGNEFIFYFERNYKLAKQDGKLDKTHNRIYLIFLPDKKKLSHFLKDVCFYFTKNLPLL